MTPAMNSFPPPEFEAKLCSPDALPSRAAALARPLVFTNGVFDLLHPGHTRYLADARREGDVLIVAVGRDRMVKADWVAAGATVIDVGINRVPTPDGKGRRDRRGMGGVGEKAICTVANGGCDAGAS